MAEPTTAQTKKAARKPKARRAAEPEQAKTKLARSAYLQTKMDVSTPGDKHEQEADRVAEEVSRMPKGVARSAEEHSVPPGSSTPTSNVGNEQSLQTKISRLNRAESEAEAATKLARTEDENVSPLRRQEDEAQTKLNRAEDESLATKISRADTADEAQTKLHRAEDEQLATKISRAETDDATNQTETGGETEPQTPVVTDDIEQKINALKGQGQALPDDVKADMESKFNADFSDVSIHTSGDADALCKQLSARAFAVGNDLFFATGEYAPETDAGRKLLAHELTHVVQQSSGVGRKVFRDAIDGTPEYTVSSGDYIGSKINTESRRLEINKITLPKFKGDRHRNKFSGEMRLKSRGQTQQRSNWIEEVTSSASTRVTEMIQQARTAGGVNESQQFFFEGVNNVDFILFGREASLREKLEIPFWDKNNNGTSFQVDHIKECQLGGEDVLDNYELLEASANMSSGSKIHHEINKKIKGAIDALRSEHTGNTNIPRSSNLGYIKSNYMSDSDTSQRGIIFKNSDFNMEVSGLPDRYWSLSDIRDCKHADILRPITEARLQSMGDTSGPLSIYASQRGGEALPDFPAPNSIWVPRVRFMEWEPNDDASSDIAGYVNVDVFKSGRSDNVMASVASEYADYLEEWPVRRINGIHGGYIVPEDQSGMGFTGLSAGARASLNLPGMSPIVMDQLEFGNAGFIGSGRVLPTVPLIGDANIQILIRGDEVMLQKTFELAEFTVPNPFSIDSANLSVFFSSTRGLGVEGQIDFGIDRVGEGFLGASASTEGGFALEGEFNFDERLFGEGTNAQVRVGYADEQWSMGGSITIPEGKVPGIQTATINVNYSEADGFSASGDATLNVPGVESGTLAITQSEEAGFSIGGRFNLSADTPGIRGGSIEASVTEKPDGTGYAVSATGEAEPDIPGVNSNLSVSYNDGAFTADINADYSRGMLSGTVNVGVTNRSVGEDGQLSETAEEGNPLIVYGGGSLALQLAPWLRATAGVQFSPNGEITVTGEIGLPDELEIFRRYQVDKSIFNIAVQAPIFPGIVAEVGGGLSSQAGIGPGVIDQLRLGVTYNPDHEDQTQVTGDAHLNIPADAGLRLSVRAGIGLGITGASATGGLDIGGTLGIQGAAEAGVHVDWTPTSGLNIDANVGIHAQPSFTFDIGGYVSVRALGFSVYDNRWQFASYTFGSDYRFGIKLPIHYREGEPFDISLDDVEFEVPNISTNRLLRGLIDRIS